CGDDSQGSAGPGVGKGSSPARAAAPQTATPSTAWMSSCLHRCRTSARQTGPVTLAAVCHKFPPLQVTPPATAKSFILRAHLHLLNNESPCLSPPPQSNLMSPSSAG